MDLRRPSIHVINAINLYILLEEFDKHSIRIENRKQRQMSRSGQKCNENRNFKHKESSG